MRILHIITTLDVGGAEMHLLSQVRGQHIRGHEVRVVYIKGQGTLAQDFRAAGACAVLQAPFGPGLSKVLTHIAWAEIVHSHLLKADMLAAVLCTSAGARRKLVSGKHNDEQVLKQPLVSRIHGFIGNLPQRTIALSDHVARFVEEHGRVDCKSMRRVYYGLDPAPFEAAAAMREQARSQLQSEFGFEEDAVVFICVARFAPQKAHAVLLRALRGALDGAPSEEPAPRLLLVGGDPFGDGEERAKALAAELDLGRACVFAGIRRDVPQLMAASDVFVMSSLWEGLGLVFLEAMATCLPVLASGVSAVPEVVLQGETGLLVPPAEDVPMTAAMLELSRDPDLRRRLGLAGAARRAEHFGLARMVDQTLGIYREVTEGAAADPAVLPAAQ